MSSPIYVAIDTPDLAKASIWPGRSATMSAG